ncbi:MAG: hypothetical protein A2Z38_08350 [Planctomycetes bacterium RBG_19FT_COMBO_48_8]|nr:MAG: hypothetical protein A2Z38_08350 [Planctomycetes bacterium RBG_19FT_COMBO_48_8]
MMRNLIAIGATMLMLFAAGWANAEVCEIVNGSFEDDGPISDITTQEPNGWDVNVPSGQFTGKTDASWSTDGSFSLFLSSQWFKAFDANDAAILSQEVFLDNVNEITFDLKLNTYTGSGWDPNNATAIMLIDDEVVWEPNSASSDIRGEYIGQSYAVEDKYRDEKPHKLSFGLRINIDTEGGFFEFYRVWWDSIECVIYCGGGGLLAGDFNRDCFVDANDLQQVTDVWLLEVVSDDKHNLFRDDDLAGFGTINFFDLAILADNWLLRSFQEQQEVSAVNSNGY